MKNISKFFIDNYKLTIVLSVGLAIYGLMGLATMNAESYPSVNFATASIITPYDGASAEDIEVKITKKIEDEIRGVSGLKDVRSISQAGLSTIVVRADMDNPKVDVGKVLADVQKAVDRTSDLPSDLKDDPIFTEVKSEEFPVIEIAVVGDNTNRKRDLLAEEFQEELEDNKKIKGVRLTGHAKRAFQIYLDSDLLDQHHISSDEVLTAIRLRNANVPGGALKSLESQALVRIEGKIENNEDLKNLVIRSNFSGETIKLSDIAKVQDSAEEIKTRVNYNQEEATLIIINKKSGADTIELVSEINKSIENFRSRYPEYKFNTYFNEGKKVVNRVQVLTSNAVSGLVLVVVFLFFFLPGKIGLAASTSLPLAVMGTMGVMSSMGYNLDAITVLALVIALGMLVDNSVVISENFTRLRRDGLSPREASTESVKVLWLPITATAFTTIAAFLPMLVTKGIMGEFIKYIPIIVCISLVISLGESFFFLPMRLRFAGKNVLPKDSEKNSDWFEAFEKKFETLMRVLVRKRYLVALAFSGVIAVSFFFIFVANKFILFPADQTEMYIARLEMENGTRIERTYEKVDELSKSINEKLGKDATHIVGRAGVQTMGPSDPKAKEGNNVGMVSIFVSEDFKNNMSHTQVLRTLREIELGGLKSLSFEALINGPPVGNAIEATFKGNSFEKINSLISKIIQELSTVDGVLDLKMNDVVGDDEIYVKVDYEKASRLGIPVKMIGDAIRTSVSGNRVSSVTLNNKDIDLIVRLKEKNRRTIEDLSRVSLKDPRDNLVPLGSFASFNRIEGNPQIKRFDFRRSKTLTGDVNEEKITSMVANQKLVEIYNKYSSDFPGITLSFGGAAENTKESMESLLQALIMSLIGIFALLVFLFRSYLRPAIIMSTIPLGLLGFGIAFYLHQRPVSFLALIGIIGLGGIIVNSGIVLISFIDNMKEEGKLEFEEILAKASGMRLRAVLVTSLTTISGLLPTAYGIGGTDALLVPMTLAMAWGLTSGTILTLVWVPCAYAILEDFVGLMSKLFTRKIDSTSVEVQA